MSDSTFFQGDPDAIRSVSQRAQVISTEIDTAFERWGALDERS
jgi:hypothetical protein